MSDLCLSLTNQQKQRARFFYHLAGDAASRFNVISPYSYETSDPVKLVYSQEDLNMRRKAEILKYSTNDHNKQKKQNYSFLAKKHTKTRPCPTSNHSKSTSSSGVPGPIIQLFEDPNIPLYNYKDQSKQFNFQNIPFDNFKRIFDTFPLYNIITPNDYYVNLMDIIILNPDNNQFRFDFSIPISIEYTADFNPITNDNSINTSLIAIFSSTLNIMYSDTLISSNVIPYRSNPRTDNDIVVSTVSMSVDFSRSVTGEVLLRQYIGNIILNNVTIQTVTQYVYTLFLKINTNYAEYSLDPNIQEPARQNNGTGSDMTNDDAINIRNVKYKYITNFDNTNSILLNEQKNCVAIFYDGDGNEIQKEDVVFKPFNITAAPI